jgi:hypothetical protein
MHLRDPGTSQRRARWKKFTTVILKHGKQYIDEAVYGLSVASKVKQACDQQLMVIRLFDL